MTDAVTPTDLAQLANKYSTLAELRRARLRGEPIPEKSVFKTLAERFPGVLRELDTLPLEQLDQRALLLQQASAHPSTVQPWMLWVHYYHQWLRAALWIKIRLQKPGISTVQLLELCAHNPEIRTLGIDSSFIASVTSPQNGRMKPSVLQKVAETTGGNVEEISAFLFPKHHTCPPNSNVQPL